MKKIIALLCLLTMLFTISVNAEEKERKTAKNYRYYMEFSFTADTDMCTINGVNRRIDENETIIPYISEKTGDFMLPLRAIANFYELYVHWDSEYPDLILLTSSPIEEKANEFGDVEYNAEPELVIELHSGYIDLQGNVVSSSYRKYDACLYKKKIGNFICNTTHMYSENINGRTFVPAQSIANIFGFTTEWIEEEKKMILTEIPDEELYVQEVSCIVIYGNMLRIISHSENNTDFPIYRVYPHGVTEWPQTSGIYNSNGHKVWPKEGDEEWYGSDYTEILYPGEKETFYCTSSELSPGKYYFETYSDISYKFCHFRSGNDKTPIRIYFEIE